MWIAFCRDFSKLKVCGKEGTSMPEGRRIYIRMARKDGNVNAKSEKYTFLVGECVREKLKRSLLNSARWNME